MDEEIRNELGIPIRIKPEPVKERKAWEEPDEEIENEPNLLVIMIGNFIKSTPCYVKWLAWKEGRKTTTEMATTTTTSNGGTHSGDGWEKEETDIRPLKDDGKERLC